MDISFPFQQCVKLMSGKKLETSTQKKATTKNNIPPRTLKQSQSLI